MINEEKLNKIMLELGFADVLSGTAYLREAVRLYASGNTQIVYGIFPEVAGKFCTQAQRVERCIRHAIERAWVRGSVDAQGLYFGYTVDPAKGKPTVGECIARLARVCREN